MYLTDFRRAKRGKTANEILGMSDVTFLTVPPPPLVTISHLFAQKIGAFGAVLEVHG